MQTKWKHDVHPFLVAFLLALFDHIDGVPSLVFIIICDLLLDCHKTFIFCHYSWFVVGWVRKHSICPDNIVHDVVERKLHYFWGPACRQRPIFELQKIQMSIVCNRQRCHSIILDIYGWYIGWKWDQVPWPVCTDLIHICHFFSTQIFSAQIVLHIDLG